MTQAPIMSRVKSTAVDLPAVLGGTPAFAQPVPITMPTVPPFGRFKDKVGDMVSSGMLTNSRNVAEFESTVARQLGVRHAIALNSCTSGLMLILRAMELRGEVIVPSFTFHATAHAVVWNGLSPVFVDCDPETFNIDLREIEKAITPRTVAIVGVHIFGNPCDIESLESIARKHRLKLLFDAAHGFGAQYRGRPVGGFGNAESFSLSPTKLVTAGEGGIVATNDSDLAQKIRWGRNYGDPGTYDCLFSGISARMNEFSAILGIESLKMIEDNVTRRNRVAALYKERLSKIPGVRFQRIAPKDRSSYKDFAIIVDEDKFGIGRDNLCEALGTENIIVKKYFYPPVHKQQAFLKYSSCRKKFIHTNAIAANTLSLPLYSHMPEDTVVRICEAIERIYAHRAAVCDLPKQIA